MRNPADTFGQLRPSRVWWLGPRDTLVAGLGLMLGVVVLGSAWAFAYLHAQHLTYDEATRPHGPAATLVWVVSAPGFRAHFAVALAVLAAGLPAIYVLVNHAFRPLHLLSEAARRVACGQYQTVPIRRHDALGMLASSFNDMVLRLAEQKRLADEANARLIEANLNLEARIEDRTAAIEAASRQLASEIDEKEDFLRAVSHDLNAPLRNIDGMVGSILRKYGGELPAEAVHRLERIVANVAHETQLIGELLDLSRIRTRRDKPETVCLERLVWELRGIFENDLREREIDLIVETTLPTLFAEKNRLRQVFQNLIDNAIKYMGESVTREIRIGAAADASEVRFWVADTGRGVAPEDADKIFYVFRRGTNHDGVAGKGVGLASVKSILQNYRGSIRVEPNPKGGSVFRFGVNAAYLKPAVPRPGDADKQAA